MEKMVLKDKLEATFAIREKTEEEKRLDVLGRGQDGKGLFIYH